MTPSVSASTSSDSISVDVTEALRRGIAEHVPPPIAIEVLSRTECVAALRERLDEKCQTEREREIAFRKRVGSQFTSRSLTFPSPEEAARHVRMHLPRSDWYLIFLTAIERASYQQKTPRPSSQILGPSEKQRFTHTALFGFIQISDLH